MLTISKNKYALDMNDVYSKTLVTTRYSIQRLVNKQQIDMALQVIIKTDDVGSKYCKYLHRGEHK